MRGTSASRLWAEKLPRNAKRYRQRLSSSSRISEWLDAKIDGFLAPYIRYRCHEARRTGACGTVHLKFRDLLPVSSTAISSNSTNRSQSLVDAEVGVVMADNFDRYVRFRTSGNLNRASAFMTHELSEVRKADEGHSSRISL